VKLADKTKRQKQHSLFRSAKVADKNETKKQHSLFRRLKISTHTINGCSSPDVLLNM
jgi:hypothetical protein